MAKTSLRKSAGVAALVATLAITVPAFAQHAQGEGGGAPSGHHGGGAAPAPNPGGGGAPAGGGHPGGGGSAGVGPGGIRGGNTIAGARGPGSPGGPIPQAAPAGPANGHRGGDGQQRGGGWQGGAPQGQEQRGGWQGGGQRPEGWGDRNRAVYGAPRGGPGQYHSEAHGNYRAWGRDWRGDGRYDWRGWRDAHRDAFHVGRYNPPYRNYYYSRLAIGYVLDPLFWGDSYWIYDADAYRLPSAYAPYRWVRYYDDALLVDTDSGQVVDTIYDFFW
jgi:hypothetical protein